MSINNKQNDFDYLINNLSDIVHNEESKSGSGFEMFNHGHLETPPSFEQIVEKTDQLFSSCLETNNLSEKVNEYVPGRIFVRLERIAMLRYGLTLDQAHEIMQPFIQKTLKELCAFLPSHTIVSRSIYKNKIQISNCFEINHPMELQVPAQGVFLKPMHQEIIDGNRPPPFYFEKQEKLKSCQLHAFNTAAGDHYVDLSADLLQGLNVDRDGIEIDLIHKIDKAHIAVPVSIDDFFNLDRFKECQSLMAATGVHEFTYRKDSNGQWWKIDSLYNIGDWNFQIPVDLKEERSAWWGGIHIILDHPTKLKKHICYELEGISNEFSCIEKFISSDNCPINELRVKISDLLMKINQGALTRLNNYSSFSSNLKMDTLTSLQPKADGKESDSLQQLRQIVLSIRQKQYNHESSKQIILNFRDLLNSVINNFN